MRKSFVGVGAAATMALSVMVAPAAPARPSEASSPATAAVVARSIRVAEPVAAAPSAAARTCYYPVRTSQLSLRPKWALFYRPTTVHFTGYLRVNKCYLVGKYIRLYNSRGRLVGADTTNRWGRFDIYEKVNRTSGFRARWRGDSKARGAISNISRITIR